METLSVRSTIKSRLDSIDEEYARVCAERDALREALAPLAAQIAEMNATVQQLMKPSRKGALLPSAKGKAGKIVGRADQPTEADVDEWIEQYEVEGLAVNQIATKAGVAFDTVKRYLETRGIEVSLRGRVKRCVRCNLPLSSPAVKRDDLPPVKDGVCGLCQYTEAELAVRREGNGHPL